MNRPDPTVTLFDGLLRQTPYVRTAGNMLEGRLPKNFSLPMSWGKLQ